MGTGFEGNIAEVFEAIAARIGEREAIVTPTRRLTFAEISDRSNRLANLLIDRGIGCRTERDGLEPWESGQDHVALYLLNGPEYMEGMLASWKARGVSLNVNYRYVADELISLLTDADAKAIVYHARFAPVIAEIRDALPSLTTLIQVADESGEALLDGALDYEDALAAAPSGCPDLPRTPDDLYMVYTGGTTGLPKGVLWRQADIWVASMGGSDPRNGEEFDSLEAVVTTAVEERIYPYIIAAPLMHGGGHWLAWLAWMGGDPVVFGHVVDRLDPADFLRTIERERCSFTIMIGNAFGRPILDEYYRGHERGEPYDFSSMRVLSTGAAAMTTGVKAEFLAINPKLRVIDSIGASESGTQGRNVTTEDDELEAGIFAPGPGTGLVAEDHSGPIDPTPGATGWLSRHGRIPLGYLGDREKTERTFPTIEGIRYTIPGDRAEWLPDGRLKLLGRDSVCINTGGEKVFVEEVEAVLHAHPAIQDAVVVGRPNERWGNEVCAVVSTNAPVTTDELIDHCDGHLARYKLPRTVITVPEVVRGPNGKADYRWAAQIAANEGDTQP
ncbi:MAG: acyl-CoA synthetase [Actinomycetota bacterium]